MERLHAYRRGELPHPPIARLTGLRMTDGGLGSATFAMPASGWWDSGTGVFFAGAMAFVADNALGAAVTTAAPPGFGMTTSELSISFLRPASERSERIIARGRLIHASRSLALSEVFLEDARGTLLGHGTSRCVIFPVDVAAYRTPELPLDPGDDAGDLYLAPVEGEKFDQEFWDRTSGLEAFQMSRDGTASPAMVTLLGIRVLEVTEGTISCALKCSPWLANAAGMIYGGSIAALADYAMVGAAGTTAPAGTAYNALDLKVYYLRPVPPDGRDLLAQAHVVHRGRSIAVVHCDILTADGKHAAIADQAIYVSPGRPWERPRNLAQELGVAP